MKHLIFFILFFISCFSFAQEKENNSVSPFFIEAELLGGKIAPNVPNFPKSKANLGIHCNIGFWNQGNNAWSKFYNYPETGIQIGYNWLGNNDVFGQQLSVLPYIVLPTSKKRYKGIQIKLGLGTSYFSKKYSLNNTSNLFIGSHITWAFHTFIYKPFLLNNQSDIKIGIGFMHASNGHTELPNFGLNSGVLSIAYQFFPKEKKYPIFPKEKENIKKEKHFYLQITQGVGTHELGGPIHPIGGKDRVVLTSKISGAILFKNHILVRSGFAYRYYQQYRNYIQENNLIEYNQKPIQSSSNILFFIGSEFLIGHFSMDIEGGFNLYKPFYKTHFEVFENTNNYDKITKTYFSTRLGINTYLFNTKNAPKHNLSLGAFLVANFGQADFSELALTYIYKIK